MKRYLLFLLCAISVVGCTSEGTNNSNMPLYYFDLYNSDISKATLLNNERSQLTEVQQIDYIVTQINAHYQPQLEIPMLIEKYALQERIVKLNLNEVYRTLTADQKIGTRVSIVYALVDLPFVDGVEFTINQMPLMTATGKPVGVIYKNDIREGALDPNPATKTFVLTVYFANNEGKLEKEVHSITGSNSSKEEKLIIEELIQGPKSTDLMPVLPKSTKINTIDTVNGVCQVDLSFDTKTKFFKDDEMRDLMIYSIVDSLTELPKIKKVIISIDGKENVTFGTMELPQTFERSETYINN